MIVWRFDDLTSLDVRNLKSRRQLPTSARHTEPSIVYARNDPISSSEEVGHICITQEDQVREIQPAMQTHQPTSDFDCAYMPLAFGVFIYTFVTFGILAWFCGYSIFEYQEGVISGLGMAAVVFIMGVVCYLDDLRRPQGWRANVLFRLTASLVRFWGIEWSCEYRRSTTRHRDWPAC